MKQIKKLLALVLALAICAAFALPAMANEVGGPASDGPFELTMSSPQAGHTYVIYQLFKGNPAKNGDDWVLANVEYGDSGWKISEKAPAEAAEIISKYSAQELNDFVGSLEYEKLTEVENSQQIANEGTESLTWELDGGYYVIKDITELEEGSDDVISGIMVRVVGPVDVTPKPTKPTPDKDIENTDPEVVGPHDYKVGDMIPYVLSAKVPAANLSKYVKPGDNESTYKLTFRDYMPEQLTYLPTKADFNVYYNNGGREVIDEGKYEINNSPDQDKDGKTPTFEISMDLFEIIGTDSSDWEDYIDDEGNIVIEVTYYAMLNAVTTVPVEGVKNQVTLVYPNNPYDPDQEGSSVSPPVEVPVYSFELDGTKVDGKDTSKVLSGAVFELKDKDGNVLEFVEDNGKYILWSNTAYSDKQTEGVGENATTFVYKVVGENENGEQVYETDNNSPKKYSVVTSVTSNTDGKFAFGGLSAGTYILHETKAPAGYNVLEKDIKIVITAEYDENNKVINVTHTVDDGTAENGTAIIVENNMGSTLPSTGGMGTTIIYIVGAVLVVGAGVLLFTKKRMHG
ncbi:SpaA isopeptide-forming pilin-related protein [Acutalibacter sp. 1XD8-36]|uniref:SpaA isopeptide-forming pilin-related protein n=1 Tax=Acutalibacter sp. 1XD8-36 TaxID=2320852 RepID=UPI00261B1579|nr:SpaA isopeptide-forming pilin-related protein [Acutalibacter sp. 1XD8-36]